MQEGQSPSSFLALTWPETRLSLYTADGRKVLEETIEGKGIWTPPSSHLPAGVYFARVSTGGYSALIKVVVLR